MPVFIEFLLVAAIIYLWESAIWLPKQAVALRKRIGKRAWRVIPANRVFTTRETGVIPLVPILPDPGLAPCGGFPLATDPAGNIYHESPDGNFRLTSVRHWEDIRPCKPRIRLGETTIRCNATVITEVLRTGKHQGLPPSAAILESARSFLSPARAKRDLNRWKKLSQPLRYYGPLLTLGFFAGLPLMYLFVGPLASLWLALWLWVVMLAISLHLYAIARHYPDSTADIRQDAFLSLLVPFHAMRAMEITSIHAFAKLHPASLMLATGDLENPWLGHFIRKLLFPRPAIPGDSALAFTLLPAIEKTLRRLGKNPADYDTPPDSIDDPDAASYCPRCHGLFVSYTLNCVECGNLPLRKFNARTIPS